MWELRGKQQTWVNVLLCLFHTADTDRTKLSLIVLSCPCRRCEHNWRQDKTVLSCLVRVSDLQLFSLKYIEDYWWKLSWLVANSFHTTDTCACRRCEIGINRILQGWIVCVYNNWRSCTNSPTLSTCTGASVPIQGGHRLRPVRNRGNQQLYYFVAL